MKKNLLLKTIVFLIAIIPMAIIFCNSQVEKSAIGKLFSSIDSLPYNKVGLLLGTSKYNANGGNNLYFDYRVKAAVSLIKAGKIEYLVVSGDNGRKSYNEPEMMRQDLMNAGVDSSVIFFDYAGFRTFDSIVRIKKIFGQHAVTIISQQFHNERAIFIASKESINAIAYNAQDVGKHFGYKVQLREKLARVKVYLDYLFGNSPKFLGAPVHIPA